MTRPKPVERNEWGDAGFTLAELLVALALLAVVLSLASGGIRFGTRVWEATRAIDEGAELAAARRVLSYCLKSAAPLSVIDAQGRVALAFEGKTDGLSLVCPLWRESGAGQGAFHRLAIQLIRSGAGVELVATTEPFSRRALPVGPEAELHTLIGNVTGLSVRYFGDLGDGAGSAFHDRWSHPSRLPALVAIDLQFSPSDRRAWPVLTVAIGAARH